MADAIVLRGGSGFDDSQLTATPDKVRNGKTFYGSGTDEIQTGTVTEILAETVTLPLNGSYSIPQGVHSGNGKVVQSLQTSAGGTVYPTSEKQTLQTSNKYMTDDVYVAPLTGLKPENIKKGVTILGVTGTYEGYS